MIHLRRVTQRWLALPTLSWVLALACGRLNFEDYSKNQGGVDLGADADRDSSTVTEPGGDRDAAISIPPAADAGGQGDPDPDPDPDAGGQVVDQDGGGDNAGAGGSAGTAGTGGTAGVTGGAGNAGAGGSGPVATCGDGELDSGEDCDDGNTVTESCAYGLSSCTVCDSNCVEVAGSASLCGDGATDSGNGESCDDGNSATEDCVYGQVSCSVCGPSCVAVAGASTSYCGDAVIDAVNGESCDDANAVTEPCAYGATSCTVCDSSCSEVAGATSYCGNGSTDNGNGETCDDGNTYTEACAYGAVSCAVCNATCQSVSGATSYCGDGAIDGGNGEECDDYNGSSGDGCSSTCQTECIPSNCGALGVECGAPDDGCGTPLNCGNCGAGESCDASLLCEVVDECAGVYAGARGCESFEGGFSSWSYAQGSGSVGEESGIVHSGSLALRATRPGGIADGGRVIVPISPTVSSGTLYFRGYYYIVTAPTSQYIKLLALKDASNNNVDINLWSDGSLDIYSHQPASTRYQSSAGVMPSGSWVCLRVTMVVSNTVGQVTVRVEGTSVVSSSSTRDTLPGVGVTRANVGDEFGESGNATTVLVDDVVIDTSPVPCQ